MPLSSSAEPAPHIHPDSPQVPVVPATVPQETVGIPEQTETGETAGMPEDTVPEETVARPEETMPAESVGAPEETLPEETVAKTLQRFRSCLPPVQSPSVLSAISSRHPGHVPLSEQEIRSLRQTSS